MPETPIAKLARRWVKRNDRPAGDALCGECGPVVAEGEGVWVRDARLVACSDRCAEAVALSLRAAP